MTEKRTDDSRENDRKRRIAAARQELADDLNCTKLEAFDRLRQTRNDSWEASNKALYTLIVGHAAGLVACMTFLKDYNAASPGSLKGGGDVHYAVRDWIVLGHSFRIGLDFRTL
jgi:hypothetical protein